MLEKTLRVLEYEKVKENVAKFVASSLGREKVINLQPSTSFEEVVALQEKTDEATKVIRLKGHVPLGGIFDVRASAKRSMIGSMLNAVELLDIASTIYGGRQLKHFLEEMVEQGVELPILAEEISGLIPLYDLEKRIKYCVSDNGELYDSASEKLRGIRQQIRTSESRVREKLESIIRSSSNQKKLSDAIVTIRNERYVIPVKQEYRNAFGGIVHDQSSSGQTLFIEPQSVVDLNNLLSEARLKEKQEVERILRELTEEVAQYGHEILINVEILAEMDFVFAKGYYSRSVKGTKPKLNDQGYLHFVKARHPLIDPAIVVPNDIELGQQFTSIVITGPNTGGKTVTLKTIGLFVLMAQSGLQLPMLDGSEICVFRQVFADIGDEQSIEQSLSTFSSHMVNIVEILKRVDHESLVLFDELGAGTDPQEGAALAISLLDEVSSRGARVVATTHYPELKAYGYNREHVMNASVEFDVDTLSPTYKLLLGVPGRSNAFEISKRLGLSDSVIDKARNHVSKETNKIENMIASLEESQKAAERDWQEATQVRKDAEKLHHQLQQQVLELNDERDKYLLEAQEKAKAEVEKAKAEAESIIKELRFLQKEQLANVKEHELIEARARLEGAIPSLVQKKQAPKVEKPKQKLRVGDEVKVLSFGQKGTLLEQSGEAEWVVQLGILKMKIQEEDIQYISRPKQVEKRAVTAVKGKNFHVNMELDLRGERYEDAMLKVEKYLDDAMLANYPRVSIIHGKGTGALRQGVQELLKLHRGVKNFRYGDMGEGGLGVTVVELK